MRFLYLFALLLFPLLGADLLRHEDFPHIAEEAWQATEPYLIPSNHRAKRYLDEIFSQPKVLASLEHFKRAGFEVICYRTSKRLAVGRHPKLKNYLVKAYLEDDNHSEWGRWVGRARGAAFVQSILDQYDLNGTLKVPRKWIYPIAHGPRKPPSNTYTPKNFIMLVEDMHVLAKEENRVAFKKPHSTAFLKELFLGLDKTGYTDCHVDNIPFCKDGRIALIDLEHYGNKGVNFDKVNNFLTPANRKYWEKLIEERETLTQVQRM